MNIPADALAELFRQNAFISALIGGFSFTLVVILITAPKEKKVTDWTIILAAIAAIGMTVCTLGWSKGAALVAFDAHDSATEWSAHTGWFLKLHHVMSTSFLVSVFLFVSCLGLSGWIRSSKLGYLTSAFACAGAVMIAWILAHSIR